MYVISLEIWYYKTIVTYRGNSLWHISWEVVVIIREYVTNDVTTSVSQNNHFFAEVHYPRETVEKLYEYLFEGVGLIYFLQEIHTKWENI